MNIYFMSPNGFKDEHIDEIISTLKIKEIINLLPAGESPAWLNKYNGIVTFRRYANMVLDDAVKKAVYTLVNKINVPVFQDHVLVEKIQMDLYKESKCDDLVHNLTLEDPNILILKDYIYINRYNIYNIYDELSNIEEKEESSVNFTKFTMNILKKYVNIDYQSRLLFADISFPSSDKNKDIYKIASYFQNISGGKSMSELREYYMTDEYIKRRQEISEEYDRRLSCLQENQRCDYDDDPWGAKSEMDYIRGSGGDWIDY